MHPDRRYLHFASLQHQFEAVEIGMQESPIQLYELYNGGQKPLEFAFDLRPLEALRNEQFAHSVVECLEHTGTVLPGVKHLVQWKFSPLEEKVYTVPFILIISLGIIFNQFFLLV